MYKVIEEIINGEKVYSIYNIPIVAEMHPDALKLGKTKRIYKKNIIESFYNYAKSLDGYLIPIRREHTSTDPDMYIEGLLELTELGNLPGYGTVIFGNALYLNESIFKAMLTGKCSYYSIQSIESGVSGEITYLSLLQKEPPEFPFKTLHSKTLEIIKSSSVPNLNLLNKVHCKYNSKTIKEAFNMPDQEKKEPEKKEPEKKKEQDIAPDATKENIDPEKENEKDIEDDNKEKENSGAILQEMSKMIKEMYSILSNQKENQKEGEDEEYPEKENEKEGDGNKDNKDNKDKKEAPKDPEQRKTPNAIKNNSKNLYSEDVLKLVQKFPEADVQAIIKYNSKGLSETEIRKLIEPEQFTNRKPIIKKENKKEVLAIVKELENSKHCKRMTKEEIELRANRIYKKRLKNEF